MEFHSIANNQFIDKLEQRNNNLFYRYSVMLDCWKSDPGERPSFEKLVKVMRTLALMNKHQVC